MNDSVDDIWTEMKSSESFAVESLMLSKKIGKEKKTVVREKNKKKSIKSSLSGKSSKEASDSRDGEHKIKTSYSSSIDLIAPKNISASAMTSKISRHINCLNNSVDFDRRDTLKHLKNILFEEYVMSEIDYSELFRTLGKKIFLCLSDPIENVRELALLITKSFFEKSTDLMPVLPYFIPALMHRLPPGLAYDDDMKIFVHDTVAHEEYRRGKAVERQDKAGVSTGLQSHVVVETSEEVRLIACKTLGALIYRVDSLGASSLLHPYFQEIVVYIQAQLRDPYPDLKIEACKLLQHLALQEDYIPGMKFFAVGLVRAILPVLRHRHARVRVVAVSAVKACVMVPDKDKRRGAGTEAIPDLVGFREDNVLPITGFYKADIQINYLAEVSNDPALIVREKVVDMLSAFLTVLDDRYDHQTRFLPYLLDLLTDDAESVANTALTCLQTCGKQYEQDHPDDIIERRQYGIDGDNRINLTKPLPSPFKERPRIGVRLYVRGNTKRFLFALVNELTNWTSHTRIKSAKLFKIVIVLCEEHLTMESYSLFPSLVKAVHFAKQDKDDVLESLLLEVCELMGRYTLPETFLHYLLPRMRGDVDVLQYNPDAAMRLSVINVLKAMLEGTSTSLLPPHFAEIVSVLTDPFVIDQESTTLRSEAIATLNVLILAMKSAASKRGIAAIETDHFQTTGRLITNIQIPIRKAFQFLLEAQSHSALLPASSNALTSLAALDALTVAGGIYDGHPSDGSVKILFLRLGNEVLVDILQTLEVDEESVQSAELRTVMRLLESPWRTYHQSHQLVTTLLESLCHMAECAKQARSTEIQFLMLLSNFLVMALNSWLGQPKDLQQIVVPVAYSKLITSQDAVALSLEYKIKEDIINVISNYMERILAIFVIDQRWDFSALTMQRRMLLLTCLCRYSEEFPIDLDCIYDIPKGFPTAIIWNQVQPLVINNLLRSSLQHSVTPTCTEALRASAVTVIARLTHCYLLPKTTSGILRNGRIIPFSKRKDIPTFSKVSRQMSENYYTVAENGLLLLVNLLDDTSDAVRLSSLESLYLYLPLLQPDIISSNSGSCMNDLSVSEVNSNSEPMKAVYTLHFTYFVTRLVKILVIAGGSGEFVSQLDSLLRAAAVLDNTTFVNLVTVMLHNCLDCSENDKPNLFGAELCSGLIDHCEILRNLTSNS